MDPSSCFKAGLSGSGDLSQQGAQCYHAHYQAKKTKPILGPAIWDPSPSLGSPLRSGKGQLPGKLGRREEQPQLIVQFLELLKCPLDVSGLVGVLSHHLYHINLQRSKS